MILPPTIELRREGMDALLSSTTPLWEAMQALARKQTETAAITQRARQILAETKALVQPNNYPLIPSAAVSTGREHHLTGACHGRAVQHSR